MHAAPTWALPVARAFTDELCLRFAVGDLMRDGDALAGLVRSGAVDPTVVASEIVPLADAPDAYRIGLRTFSAAESRTVIGNTDAFELPSVPGSAYLKVDTTVYRRLRVSTVSAPYTWIS